MSVLKKKDYRYRRTNLKVVHLPYEPNPYLRELADKLRAEHHEIIFGRTINFQLVNLSILYALAKHRALDIIHLHWQHPFFLSKTKLGALLKSFVTMVQLHLAKALGKRIIWTVHNLKNHMNMHRDLELFFSGLLAKLADAIIAHCPSAKSEIQKRFKTGAEKIIVIPHGNFINKYENVISRQEAKTTLGLRSTDFVFLFFGTIRRYKGVLKLIQTFKRLQAADTRLVIAGYPKVDRFRKTIEQQALLDDRIFLMLQYIQANDVQIYMNAADIVILPYHDVLTSGAALLGMSFGKPLIAPRRGCIPDLLKGGGSFTFDPDKRDGLLQAMREALKKESQLKRIGRRNLQEAERLGWSEIAKMTSIVYQQCLMQVPQDENTVASREF
jgi:glycosyltransferase involved in cell wall biosynthesis